MNYIQQLGDFTEYLVREEKSQATIGKYIRDVRSFLLWCGGRELSKEVVLGYKGWLVESYAPTSVNSMLASVNCFLYFVGRGDCRVKQLKIQRHLFARSFYAIEKDVVRLADLLGHSSINTTRIYTMDTGTSHIRSVEKVIQWLTS